MNSDLFKSHTMFKHLHGKSIKDKENFNQSEEEDSEFIKMRRSLKFKDEKEKKGKKVFSEINDFSLMSNNKFNNLRKSIKYEEEEGEYHKKRRKSEKTFQTRQQKRDNSKSIFSSKRLSSQFNNGLLH